MTLAYPDPPLTDGLVMLRPWEATDSAALVEAWADPTIQETCAVPDDRSEIAASGWISRHEHRLDRHLALDLVVSDANGVSVLGEVGLGPFDRERNAAVLGFWIGSAHRGVGRASSAVALLVEWVFRTDISVLLAQTTAENLGSIRVLDSCGFKLRAPHKDGGETQTWVRRSTSKSTRL